MSTYSYDEFPRYYSDVYDVFHVIGRERELSPGQDHGGE